MTVLQAVLDYSGFSSTLSEIAPTARVLRDLKGSGELAI